MKFSSGFVNSSLDVLNAVSGRDSGTALLHACVRAHMHTVLKQ